MTIKFWTTYVNINNFFIYYIVQAAKPKVSWLTVSNATAYKYKANTVYLDFSS